MTKQLILSIPVLVLLLIFSLVWSNILTWSSAEAASPVVAPTRGPTPPKRAPLNSPIIYYFPMISRASAPLPVLTTYDWLQFGFDSKHSGNNSLESWITPGNVGGLHILFQVILPSSADSAPAFLANVTMPGGIRDLVFVTTRAGHIIALDAHTGAQAWSHQSGAGGCQINGSRGTCYTTSSPAVDPNRQFVYSYGLDGYVHKYFVGDGTETVTGGWPELTTLKGYDEKGSSSLSIAAIPGGARYLYVTHAGYPGDQGDYQGHITAINLADGTQKVFNAVCSDQAVHFVGTPGTPDCPEVQGGIWGRAGVVYDSDKNRIYASTGNATFSPANYHWGDSILALNPDGSGTSGIPLDSYTPANYQYLQDQDFDLGSTTLAMLPPSSGNYTHLGVQGGKDSVLRLINLDNMSGQGGPGLAGGEVFSMSIPMGNVLLQAPAVWVSPYDQHTWVFAADDSGIAGLRLVVDGGGNPSLQTMWLKTAGWGGQSPIVANNILFYAGGGHANALNPMTGAVLWATLPAGAIHWASPIVASGILYLPDQGAHLTAYVP